MRFRSAAALSSYQCCGARSSGGRSSALFLYSAKRRLITRGTQLLYRSAFRGQRENDANMHLRLGVSFHQVVHSAPTEETGSFASRAH